MYNLRRDSSSLAGIVYLCCKRFKAHRTSELQSANAKGFELLTLTCYLQNINLNNDISLRRLPEIKLIFSSLIL